MKDLILSLLVAISAVVGWEIGVRWKRHAQLHQDSRESVAIEPQMTYADAARNGKPRWSLPLSIQLQQELARSTGVTNALLWLAAIEKAQPQDYLDLALIARGNTDIWRVILDRWINSSPRSLFDALIATAKGQKGLPLDWELTSWFFTQWAKKDPDAAIAAMREPGAQSTQPWQLLVAQSILNSDPERGLQLMADWHIEHYGPPMDGVVKWAAASPQHAAEFTIAHPAGFVSQLAIDSIANVWAKTDPATAVKFAQSQTGELASRLANTVFKQWASMDLDAASGWLAKATDQIRTALSPALMESWAKHDAPAALSWSASNLSGVQLAQAITGVMDGAAVKDINAAASLVTEIPPGEARSKAAAVVAQKWFPSFFSGAPIPPDAIKWISTLDENSIKRVLGQVSFTWSGLDPQGMAHFLSTVHSDWIPDFTLSQVATEWARTDPKGALQWSSTLPGDRALSTGTAAFAVWQQSQPEAANSWLNGLQSEDPRREVFAKR